VTGYTFGYRPDPEQKHSLAVGGFLESEEFKKLIGHRIGPEKKLSSPPYPASGFLISEEFRNLDGPAGMFSMCRTCQANATRNEIAGCCGTLSQWLPSDNAYLVRALGDFTGSTRVARTPTNNNLDGAR